MKGSFIVLVSTLSSVAQANPISLLQAFSPLPERTLMQLDFNSIDVVLPGAKSCLTKFSMFDVMACAAASAPETDPNSGENPFDDVDSPFEDMPNLSNFEATEASCKSLFNSTGTTCLLYFDVDKFVGFVEAFGLTPPFEGVAGCETFKQTLSGESGASVTESTNSEDSESSSDSMNEPDAQEGIEEAKVAVQQLKAIGVECERVAPGSTKQLYTPETAAPSSPTISGATLNSACLLSILIAAFFAL